MVRLRLRSFLTLFLIALFVFAVVQVEGMPFEARVYPWVISFAALFLLVIQLARELRQGEGRMEASEEGAAADIEVGQEEKSPAGQRKVAETLVWLLAFTAGLRLLGYQLAIPLVIFLFFRRHREPWLISVLLPAIAWALVWGIFGGVLHLPFPQGWVFEWVG